jgi:hypothetical protein
MKRPFRMEDWRDLYERMIEMNPQDGTSKGVHPYENGGYWVPYYYSCPIRVRRSEEKAPLTLGNHVCCESAFAPDYTPLLSPLGGPTAMTVSRLSPSLSLIEPSRAEQTIRRRGIAPFCFRDSVGIVHH